MWSLKTDGPLVRAFTSLAASEDVLCFHNFASCPASGLRLLGRVLPLGAHPLVVDCVVTPWYRKDYVFYSSQDVSHATVTGMLPLSFGDLNTPVKNSVVGYTLVHYLHKAGLEACWDGSAWLLVRLHTEDLRLMHFFEAGASGIAQFHRKHHLWSALRKGVRAARRQRLDTCFQAWACRPQLCAYRRAKMSFESLVDAPHQPCVQCPDRHNEMGGTGGGGSAGSGPHVHLHTSGGLYDSADPYVPPPPYAP